MSRIAAVAGIHLDHAWPDLGPAFGDALRARSREVLVEVVDRASQGGADTIVFVGDLLTRSTVMPETVDFAMVVLGGFAGEVLIAPGPSDWVGEGGPYEVFEWPDNVHVWRSSAFEPAPARPAVWGSAWTSPVARGLRVSPPDHENELRVLIRAGVSEPDLSGRAATYLVLTSNAAEATSVTVLADVIHPPGAPDGSMLLLTDQAIVAPGTVTIAGSSGTVITLDVTDQDASGFAAAVKRAGETSGPVLLRLEGQLPAHILLPGYGGPEVATNVVLNTDLLGYAVESPDAGDRSTRAEFLRAMALTGGDALERHQTTALGLEALLASGGGV